MISSTVWDKLVATLKADPTLSVYIKNVYEARRYDIEADSLPCIMLEPIEVSDAKPDFNTVQDLHFKIDVYAFSSGNFTALNKTISGDDDYKGTLNIENDIRKCLTDNNTLGDTVIDIKIDGAFFAKVDLDKYPARGLIMPIQILYRQIDGE